MRSLTGFSGTSFWPGAGVGGGLVGAFSEGGFLFCIRPIKQLFGHQQAPANKKTGRNHASYSQSGDVDPTVPNVHTSSSLFEKDAG
jgi:hypothetical protein